MVIISYELCPNAEQLQKLQYAKKDYIWAYNAALGRIIEAFGNRKMISCKTMISIIVELCERYDFNYSYLHAEAVRKFYEDLNYAQQNGKKRLKYMRSKSEVAFPCGMIVSQTPNTIYTAYLGALSVINTSQNCTAINGLARVLYKDGKWYIGVDDGNPIILNIEE